MLIDWLKPFAPVLVAVLPVVFGLRVAVFVIRAARQFGYVRCATCGIYLSGDDITNICEDCSIESYLETFGSKEPVITLSFFCPVCGVYYPADTRYCDTCGFGSYDVRQGDTQYLN